MELMTISEVSKAFQISTRTLRYYEQIGLLASIKKEDYAYRTYDQTTLMRLQQIIVLRKLRIPLKQISLILSNEDALVALDLFQNNVNEIEEEITALSTIRTILQTFIRRLDESIVQNIKLDLLDDEAVRTIVDTLCVTKTHFKEEKSMQALNQAEQSLGRLKNVRILYLPPVTVASSHYIGDNPEEVAGTQLYEFVQATKLCELKPDLRVFGFNNPCPKDGKCQYGYEFWATIPENMDVPEPLEKKHFAGGLYAAHCIKMGNFHEWRLLCDWLKENDQYEEDQREPMGMYGSLEEHLNAFTYYQTKQVKAEFVQLDLLIPIKEKQK
ncbi:effector binding domain-containing protein [Paludicola sp. MB14-C6]|uniref:MerR family transcriptional regulator n=1 Tax=Paludihabitans sp. MB14-C6 TaxID=3070656 RepID=UPI0027DD1A18|nr:effector binding domain-containing protein [Paludicola sp. MB14-C6]WMJ21942.1 effector binding domain-containing protein [Paludicola sp. MB14-C6]